jgi:hypothetical protein
MLIVDSCNFFTEKCSLRSGVICWAMAAACLARFSTSKASIKVYVTIMGLVEVIELAEGE